MLKMEAHCSTGQSPQWAVVPMEEEQQQDAVKFVLLILLSLLYMFRATVSPTFGSALTVYIAFWNNVLQ